MPIKPLPHWAVTDKNPAFYDTESATAIEQTAKLYGAMQNMIATYNEWEKSVNEHIAKQDKDIEESIKYIKDNLYNTIDGMMKDMRANNEFDTIVYNTFQNINNEVEKIDSRLKEVEKTSVEYDEKTQMLAMTIKEVK